MGAGAVDQDFGINDKNRLKGGEMENMLKILVLLVMSLGHSITAKALEEIVVTRKKGADLRSSDLQISMWRSSDLGLGPERGGTRDYILPEGEEEVPMDEIEVWGQKPNPKLVILYRYYDHMSQGEFDIQIYSIEQAEDWAQRLVNSNALLLEVSVIAELPDGSAVNVSANQIGAREEDEPIGGRHKN